MGARKEHRDAQHSRRYFDQVVEEHRYSRADEVVAGRLYDRALRERDIQLEANAATIAGLQAQVASLAAERDEARAQIDILTAERDQQQRRADRQAEWAGQMRDAFLATKRKHEKLSGIVRLGWPAEEYHRWHKIYEEMNP